MYRELKKCPACEKTFKKRSAMACPNCHVRLVYGREGWDSALPAWVRQPDRTWAYWPPKDAPA